MTDTEQLQTDWGSEPKEIQRQKTKNKRKENGLFLICFYAA